MRQLAIVLALFLSTPAVAEIYRCQGPDGKTIYSDAPCASRGTEAKRIKPDYVDPETARYAAAFAAKVPAVGMRRDDVIRMLGQPSRVNTSIYESGTQEQLVYDDRYEGKPMYVYIRGGKVSSVSH